VTPYYEQSGVTIYHGGALAVLDMWEGFRSQSFDLLLTDPPYGIREARSNNKSRSALAVSRDYGVSSWDDRPAHEAIAMARRFCRWQIVFGGNYYDLPASRCWLVWDKENGANDFADCELAWTNLDKAIRRIVYRWQGMLQEPGIPRELRQHPTQKPEAVMRWALLQAPESVRTVLDPFMGSGTTLVAAKRLGRVAVGIEREERYCEIAAQRLQQEAFDFSPETDEPRTLDAGDPVGLLGLEGTTRD
jgi:DNA modification methylase